jgi:cytoskeletal protein CcmA (bactofilin family)
VLATVANLFLGYLRQFREIYVFKFLASKRLTLDKIETIIGENSSFEGHLKCDGNVRIDGLCLGGIIETLGNVVVSPEAQVSAKIIAENVSVAGEVTGSINARGRLEILSSGRVYGDVRVQNFYKDPEGVLSGNLFMSQDETELLPVTDFQQLEAASSDEAPSALPPGEPSEGDSSAAEDSPTKT